MMRFGVTSSMRGNLAARWKSVRRTRQPRRDDAAEEVAVRRDDVEGCRRADVDDNQGPAVLLESTRDVDDAVGADLAWILIGNAEARLDARPHDERMDVEVALAHLDHRHHQRRHDGRYDDRPHLLHADVLIREEVVDEHAILVARLLPVRRDAPMAQELLPLVGAHHDIAVSNVKNK